MAKRGQRYPLRVRYLWTPSGLKGTVVASDLEEANIKADRIAEAARRRDDANVLIHIVSADDQTTAIRTIDTEQE